MSTGENLTLNVALLVLLVDGLCLAFFVSFLALDDLWYRKWRRRRRGRSHPVRRKTPNAISGRPTALSRRALLNASVAGGCTLALTTAAATAAHQAALPANVQRFVATAASTIGIKIPRPPQANSSPRQRGISPRFPESSTQSGDPASSATPHGSTVTIAQPTTVSLLQPSKPGPVGHPILPPGPASHPASTEEQRTLTPTSSVTTIPPSASTTTTTTQPVGGEPAAPPTHPKRQQGSVTTTAPGGSPR